MNIIKCRAKVGNKYERAKILRASLEISAEWLNSGEVRCLPVMRRMRKKDDPGNGQDHFGDCGAKKDSLGVAKSEDSVPDIFGTVVSAKKQTRSDDIFTLVV